MTKFSFATVRPDMTTVPWTHIQSADIFVLLERVTNTADPNMQIRVVEGSNTLVGHLQQMFTVGPSCLCFKLTTM